MTHEELIAGFLDRSLSEDQLVELEAARASSPAFAAELREMITLENALHSAAPVVVAPTDFLAHVENTVAAKLASNTSAGAFASISTTWKAIGSAAVILGSAAGIYYATQSPTAVPTPVQRPYSAPAVTAPAPTSSVPAAATPAPTSVTTSVTRNAVTTVEPAVPAPSADGSMSATTTKTDPVLDKLIKQFEACRANNDRTRCAQYAVQIGAKHRSLKNYADADAYYKQALSIARSMHIVQYEVDALGGLGLLSIDRGNDAEARTYLRNAIESAAGVQDIDVERYRRTLETLGN